MMRFQPQLPGVAWLVTATSAALMILWSIVVPVYESPDEPHHWRVARYVHDHWRLPLYDATLVEANQPPLYYTLIAPLARSDEAPSSATWVDGTGAMTYPLNPRLFLNTSDAFEHYRGLRAARILTAVLTAAGLVFVYLAAFEATGSQASALLALALVGFLPQFTFRSGTINNDTLVATFGSLTTWLTLRLATRGFVRSDALWASAAFAAAYLTKISAVGLGPPLALALLRGCHGWRDAVRRLTPLLLTLILVGPWSLRNVWLYGDPFASGAMLTAVANIYDPKTLTSAYFLSEPVRLMFWYSFIGDFGWLNVGMPIWAYRFYGYLGLAAIAALVVVLVSRARMRWVVGLTLLTAILNLAVIIHINLSFSQPQGRYLFPSIAAIAVLVAIGVASLPLWRLRTTVLACVGAFTLFVNLHTLRYVLVPAYYPAVMPRVSKTLITLGQPRMRQIEERDGWMSVVGPDPQLLLDATLCASDIAFIRFDIEGRAPVQTETGSIYFSRSDAPMDESQRVDFNWTPDGSPRTVTVALVANPRWGGLITGLRLDPVNSAATVPLMFRVGPVQIRGSY